MIRFQWFILLAMFSLLFMAEYIELIKLLPPSLSYIAVGAIGTGTLWEFLRVKNLKEKIVEQEKTIEELKIRIKDESPKSKYWELTNKQLKKRVFAHTKTLRSLKDVSSRIRAEKESGVVAESIALRDELWERLPFRLRAGEGDKKEFGYLGLYNTTEFQRFVPEDLDRMATALPD